MASGGEETPRSGEVPRKFFGTRPLNNKKTPFLLQEIGPLQIEKLWKIKTATMESRESDKEVGLQDDDIKESRTKALQR